MGFLLYIRSRERAGEGAALSTGLFRSRASNLGLVTQNMQWLLLMGTRSSSRVPPGRSRLQRDRDRRDLHGGHARHPGLLLAAERLAKRYAQRTLIVAGFVVTAGRDRPLIGLVYASDRIAAFGPGLR